MFKLLDQIEQPLLTDEKTPRDYTEDAYIVTPNLVAIADGITSKSLEERWLNEYSSDAEWLVRTFLQELKIIAEDRVNTKNDDVKDILRSAITKTIEAFNPDRGISKIDKPAASFSMVMQHMQDPTKFTFVNLGSNYLFYNDKVMEMAPTLQEMYKDFEASFQNNADHGFMIKDKRMMKPLREKLFVVNTDMGYSAVDLSYDWIDHPETEYRTETINKSDKIMLCTDGLTRCIRLYKNYTTQNLLAACEEKGLETILTDHRQIELDDWDRVKYPRFMATMDFTAFIVEVQ